MGWPFSAYAISTINVLKDAHIPMVSQTASSDALTGVSAYFFRVAPSNKSQGIAGARYAEARCMPNVWHFLSIKTTPTAVA
jgi:ABC-type branched-subunit amino acid transport system substrate-binding protein